MQLSSLVLVLAAAAPTMEERGVDELIARTPGMVTQPTLAAKTAVGNAVPVIQRTVTSSARVADLRAFFTAEFKKRGLYIAPEQEKFKPEQGEQVTGLDSENLIAYMALFQVAGKYTTVVIAAANVGQPANVSTLTEAIAPVFPGGHNVTSYHVEMIRGMTYACSGTPAEIKAFYREAFGKLGYKETEDLVFQKQSSRAWIIVSPAVTERNVAVYIQNASEGGQVQGQVPTLIPPDIKTYPKPPQSAPPPAPSPPAKPVGR